MPENIHTEQFIFSTTLNVRITDLNYGNHLGHDALISFLHEARVRFLSEIGYSELNIEGLGILITELNVSYMNQAFYSDQINIKISINSVTPARIKLNYALEIARTSQEVARAKTTLTFYDFQRKKVSKIPPEYLKKIIYQKGL